MVFNGLVWTVPDFEWTWCGWFSKKTGTEMWGFFLRGGGGILKDIVLTLNYEKLALKKSAIPKILIYRLGIIRRPIGYARGCSINTVVMN